MLLALFHNLKPRYNSHFSSPLNFAVQTLWKSIMAGHTTGNFWDLGILAKW